MAASHPTMVMNMNQVHAAMVRHLGTEKIIDPHFGNKQRTLYKAFSRATKENGFRQIIGQFASIENFVEEWLFPAARGDGAASKLPMFIGPPGTGKTLITDIFNNMRAYLGKHDPTFYQFTFEWVGIKGIPELGEIAGQGDVLSSGEGFDRPIKSPVNETPFALLPTAYQETVLDLVSESARKLIGTAPRPIRGINAQDEHVRTTLMEHYSKKENRRKLAELMSLATGATISEANVVRNGVLSPKEALVVLNHHVVVRRYLPKALASVIEAQGKDVDKQGLFGAPNGIISNLYGPDHPFAYFPTGKIPRAHRGSATFDEYFRNPEYLRSSLLGVFESKRITMGGMPPMFLDATIVGATNTESLAQADEESANKAMRDRILPIPMMLETHPLLIAQTMMLKKQGEIDPVRNIATLRMKELVPYAKIESEEAVEPKWQLINLSKAFVEPKHEGELMKGPEGRYAISVEVGDDNEGQTREPVLIAPHVLEYMADVVAVTRFVTDRTKAEAIIKGVDGMSIINDPVFFDVITRLRAVLGDWSSKTGGAAEELRTLASLLKEGSDGISLRDAADGWLTTAISMAAENPRNRGTLTMDVAKAALKKSLIEDGKIATLNTTTLFKYLALADQIAVEVYLPKVEADVNAAFGGSSGEGIEEAYNQIYSEILARNADPTARTYEIRGEVTPIDDARLTQVKELFRRNEGRELAVSEFTGFNARYATASTDVSSQHHLGLMRAIQRYYAQSVIKGFGWQKINQLRKRGSTGVSNTDMNAIVGKAMEILRIEFGYNEAAADQAMTLVEREEAKN